MRNQSFMRHSLTLLASAMAAAVSGQALGETAGKVSFVIGNVTASSPDGTSRSLRRGDAINGGDRIETRGGRLQIRFSDGGFVALQPNTVFGVDQYLYANKPPEETSLFFSLLRGGMRTVTGAIGKVNKQSYKVRTPVATIGIRGTGYRASTDGSRTLVSVGSGLVIVENELGNMTAGAGQNIVATNGAAPTLSTEGADIPATGPEGDNEEEQNISEDTPRFGEQTLADGNSPLGYCFAGVCAPNTDYVSLVEGTVLPNTDPVTGSPTFFIATPWMSQADSGLAATFAPSSHGLQLLVGGLPSPYPITIFDAGTLQFNDVGTAGKISWGEFTNGQSVTSSTLLSSPTLSSTEYAAYVIGVTPSPYNPLSSIARYTLQGGTAPRFNKTTAGTLDNFIIDVDFLRSTLDIQLDITMSSEKFLASGSGLYADSLSLGLISAYGLNTTSINGSSCLTYCSTDITGFLAGDTRNQIGAAYSIKIGSTDSITGSAALNQTSVTPYYFGSLAFAPSAAAGTSFLQLDTQSTFGSNGGLQTVVDSSGSLVFDSGTLNYSGFGTKDGLTWGEFTNGSPGLDDLNGGLLTLDATQFHPYIFGSQSTTLLGQGTAIYALQGNSYSTPRVNQKNSATLDNFKIIVNFDFALMDLFLDLSINDPVNGPLTANISGTGMNVSDIFSTGAFLLSSSTQGQLTNSGNACWSLCKSEIGGFFSGNAGAQIGASYLVSYDDGQGGSDVRGVAALGIGTPTFATVLPDAQLYTMTKTAGTRLAGGYYTGNPSGAALTGDFDANGALISAKSIYTSQTFLSNTATSLATVTNVGTNKTLSWGRFYDGEIYIDSSSTPSYLGSTGSVHYVIGQEAPQAVVSTLQGTATYVMGGHTLPTSNGSTGAASGQLTVDFDLKDIGVNMFVNMGANIYNVSDNIAYSLAQFSGVGLTTTLTAGSGCFTGCTTDISGFFSGQQAQQIGLTYTITDITAIDGAATFVRQP